MCGSTNFSWRGFFVQNNNAVILQAPGPVTPFSRSVRRLLAATADARFGETASAKWTDLGLTGIDAQVAFSPHARSRTRCSPRSPTTSATNTTSSLFYSLAFLYQTTGADSGRDQEGIKGTTRSSSTASPTGRSGGLDLQKPDGNVSPVYPSGADEERAATVQGRSRPAAAAPACTTSSSSSTSTSRPPGSTSARTTSPSPADTHNGENLLLIRDRRIAVSYMVEALRIFDHYHFRVLQHDATKAKRPLVLAKPPRQAGRDALVARGLHGCPEDPRS